MIFSDEPSASLTSDTVSGSGKNLYKYDFQTGQLIDLTPGTHAELLSVVDVSEDGSHVYFEADGALAAGATQGQPHRYLWHAGTTTFIAALDEVFKQNCGRPLTVHSWRSSPLSA